MPPKNKNKKTSLAESKSQAPQESTRSKKTRNLPTRIESQLQINEKIYDQTLASQPAAALSAIQESVNILLKADQKVKSYYKYEKLLSLYHMKLGICYMQLKKYELAKEKFDLAIFEYPHPEVIPLAYQNLVTMSDNVKPLSSSDLVEYWKQLAKFGYMTHISEVVKHYCQEKQFTKLNEFFNLYAEHISPEQYLFAYKHFMNANQQFDPSLFWPWLKRAEQLGSEEATELMMLLLSNEGHNSGVKSNPLLSAKLAGKLIKSKNKIHRRNAHYILGRAYDFGLGRKQDDKLAFEHYKAATDLEHPSATQDLAIMYRDGQFVERDILKAEQLLRAAMSYGSLEASTELLGLYVVFKLREVIHDEEQRKATISEMKAIAQRALTESEKLPFQTGNVYYYQAVGLYCDGAHRLPIVLERMTFLPLLGAARHEEIDVETAQAIISNLEKACEYDNLCALQTLGFFYQLGICVAKNLMKAYELYCQAYEISPKIAPDLALILLALSGERSYSNEEREKWRLMAHAIYMRDVNSSSGQDRNEFCGIFDNNLQIFSELLQEEKREDKDVITRRLSEIATPSNKFQGVALLILKINSINIEQPLPKVIADFQEISALFRIYPTGSAEVAPYFNDLLPLLKHIENNSLSLSNDETITIIHSLSNWPLSTQDPRYSQCLCSLLIQVRVADLDNEQFASFLFALCRFDFTPEAYRAYVAERYNHLIAERLKDLNAIGAAKVFYYLAVMDRQFSIAGISDLIQDVHGHIIRNIDSLNYLSASQVYHGYHYLRLKYPREIKWSQTSKFADMLDRVSTYLKADSAVNISREQRAVLLEIKKWHPAVSSEPVVACRRPDYGNLPDPNAVGFFHGPQHYLFSFDGAIISTTPADQLGMATLELAGFNVRILCYEQWHDAKARKAEEALIKETFLQNSEHNHQCVNSASTYGAPNAFGMFKPSKKVGIVAIPSPQRKPSDTGCALNKS